MRLFFALVYAVYPAVYAVYAISSLDTDPSLRYGTHCVGPRGTQQGAAGLTPPSQFRVLLALRRPFTFTLEEVTGSQKTYPFSSAGKGT